jgi:hypothetical protein
MQASKHTCFPVFCDYNYLSMSDNDLTTLYGIRQTIDGYPKGLNIAYNQSCSEMCTRITANTTTQEFEDYCKEFPNFKITDVNMHGCTTLIMAAHNGNADLASHIMKKRNAAILLNVACNDLPVVHWAVICKDSKKRYPTVKALIKHGANLNMCLSFKKSVGSLNFPGDATAFWIAAEKWQDVALTKLFILNGGAIVYPDAELSTKGQTVVNQALQELFVKVRLLFEALEDSGSSLSVLPKDIARVISQELTFAEQ